VVRVSTCGATRTCGRAVRSWPSFQRLFVARWFARHRENLWTERYFPVQELADPSSAVMLQLVHSSVGDQWEAVKQTFLQAVASADCSVRIQSPYFVPDQSFYDALLTVGVAGIDVRFMMTGVPDKKIPFWAARTYLPKVVASGVRVYQYTAGFFHAKSLTVDSTFCAIGTANIDVRSFSLHDEMAVFIYDEEITRQVELHFETDLAYCREVTAGGTRARGAPRAFPQLGHAARLARALGPRRSPVPTEDLLPV
jgi:cardiolipin synthase A/B